jgi:kynureninase
MHDELLAFRSQFPILEKTVYLNSNSLGPMPSGVYDELKAFADTWATRGVRAWSDDGGWWDMPITVGNILAEILDAPSGSISMHQNVSIAEAIVLSCFDFAQKRNKIVYTEMNFPSVMYVMEEQKRRGARVVTVPAEPGGVTVNLKNILAAIDQETLLVPISHVLFRSAAIQDAKAIIEKAHSVGALVVLDVYQSAGCVPLSLRELNVDMAVGGSVKWLCGGPGAGYLYVRPDLAAELRPMSTGWQAHARPFQFETGPVKWGEPAWRFLNGTPHIPALYSARSGYKIIREIGVHRIRARSRMLTASVLDEAQRRQIEVTCPDSADHRGGTVALRVPDGDAVCKELLRREIICDYRPESGIRVGPHFFNTEAECRHVVAETDAILRDRKLK